MNTGAIVLMLLLVVFGCLGSDTAKKGYRVFRFLLVVILSAVSAYCAPTAYDHENYAITYQNAIDTDFISYITVLFIDNSGITLEIGYLIINWLIAHLGIPEALFFFLISLFVNSSIIRLAYRYKNACFILMWVYLGGNILVMQQNLVRQFIAVGFFLHALIFLEEKKWLKYSIIVLLSSLVHTSALVNLLFVPLFFFIQKKKENYLQVSLLLIYLLSLFSILVPQIPQMVLSRLFVHYADYATINNKDAGMQVTFTFLILYNFLSFFALSKLKNNNWIIVTCVVILSVIYNISVSIPNGLRFIYYYTVPAYIYMFHYLIVTVEGKTAPLGKYRSAVISVSTLYFLWNIVVNFVFSEGLLFSETYRIIDFGL